MNWRTLPLARPCIAFIIGISISYNLLSISLPILVFILLLLNSTLLLAFRSFKNYNVVSLVGFLMMLNFFAFGFIRCELEKPENNKSHYLHFVNDTLNETLITVQEIKQTPKWNKYFVHLDSIKANGNMIPVIGDVLLYHKRDTEVKVKVGNQLLVRLDFLKAPKVTNPYVFDYAEYLKTKGIHHIAYIDSSDYILVEAKALNSLFSEIQSLKTHGLKIFTKYITSDEARAVATAMIFGFDDDLDQSLKTSFSESGAVHILAVSGLHVGYIYIILLAVFKIIRLKHRGFKFVLTTLCLVFYAILVGGSPSVVRSVFMFTMFAFGKNYMNGVRPLNILACCALVILFYDPLLMMDLSFILSFLAMWSIIFFMPILQGIWMPSGKLMIFIWNCVLLSISAQIMVLPYLLYTFHTLPLYFVLSGILVVPLAGVILIMGLISIGATILPWGMEQMIFNLYEWVLKLLIWTVRFIQKLPGSIIDGFYLELGQLALIYTSILTLMYFLKIERLRALYLALLFVFGTIGITSFRYHKNNQQLKLVFYESKRNIDFDLMDGQVAISYKEESQKMNPFSGRGECQSALGIKSVINIGPPFSRKSTSRMMIDIPLFYIKNEKGVLINSDSLSLASSDFVKMDIVIFNTAFVKNLDSLNFKKNAKIIIGPKVKVGLKSKLHEKCILKECRWYDLKKSGFLSINLNQSKTYE